MLGDTCDGLASLLTKKEWSIFVLNTRDWPTIRTGFRKLATLNLLRDKLVTRNNEFQLAMCNNIARQVKGKCWPYYQTKKQTKRQGKQINNQNAEKNREATPRTGKRERRWLGEIQYSTNVALHLRLLAFSSLERVTFVFCSFKRGEGTLGPTLPKITIDGITIRPKSKRKAARAWYCTTWIIISQWNNFSRFSSRGFQKSHFSSPL